MCVCVCYHLISETTRFHYLDKLTIDKIKFEMSELQKFCCKNISLRGTQAVLTFNGLIDLH